MLMNDPVLYPAAATPAVLAARRCLLQAGCHFVDSPSPVVTHLLLGVPSFDADGSLKGGGALKPLLDALSDDITVIGGNLNVPLLEKYRKLDLLTDERYLWENASITADCAIPIARQHMGRVWKGVRVLILGWGRIAKHLAMTLQALKAEVTVAARKETDQAMAASFGFLTTDYTHIEPGYAVVFNTVPAMILPEAAWPCVKIDLASSPGIGGSGVIWARGLPGKDAPESAGALIARTILSYLQS